MGKGKILIRLSNGRRLLPELVKEVLLNSNCRVRKILKFPSWGELWSQVQDSVTVLRGAAMMLLSRGIVVGAVRLSLTSRGAG